MPQRFPFPLKSANQRFPYDPFKGTGDSKDTVAYIQPPGIEFYRPWLAIPNGAAFIWPLGLEGFGISVEPTLGIHKYYGDNKVVVNVIHRGEEHITMSGNLLGKSAVDSLRQLRDVAYAVQPVGGKILYLPGVLNYAQRVAVVRLSFDRTEDARGEDITYTMDLVRTGIENKFTDPDLAVPTTQPSTGTQKASSRVFVVTSSVNTLRKIALKKLGNASKWDDIYKKNKTIFARLKVPAHSVPTYKLKVGTKVYY